jgi:dipeptidyl aminopeptidase/acylaminoacyl peptidase
LKHFILALSSAAILACGFVGGEARADSSIPLADFFKKATFGSRPVLSPDGKNLAVLTPRAGRFVLAVINLDSRESKVVASDPDLNISSPMWVNSKRLVFSLTTGSDDTAENNKGGGLFAVNSDASDFRKLVPTRKEVETNNIAYKPVQIIQRVGGDSNDLFVENNERGQDADFGASDVFRLNTLNGRMTLLTYNNPGNVGEWTLDHANVIRVASAAAVDPATKRIRQTVFYRDDENSPWKQIYQGVEALGQHINVMGFDYDNKTMYVAGRFNGRDKAAMYAWDFSKNTVGELIAEQPDADIGGWDEPTAALVFDNERKKLVGVTVEGMKYDTYYFDEERAKMHAMFAATFPGDDISNFQVAGGRAIVVTSGPNNVGKFYLYDTAKKTLEKIAVVKPEFEGKKLSEQRVINYAARDGLNIPAYLTLPEGVAPKKLPLVAYIHGGPHARDFFGYDPLTQMFASRGYAVFQPQFRMSTGFGWKHHTAGWRQWGLAMQDDITDGIADLVKKGIVDPDRICIMGASYGGYATMFGLVKDPDLYKCGVNTVGVTDVKMLFTVTYSDMSGPAMDDMGVKMHGDPKGDQAYFHNSSAIENADKIKAPVLMFYGSEDRRVPMIHGQKIRDKLLAKGNVVEWKVMTGEGHGWAKESNNILWGEMTFNFVDRYIGAGALKPTVKAKLLTQ